MLEKDGKSVLYEDYGSVKDHLEMELNEAPIGEKYRVYTQRMTQDEFDDLEEFDGFL